jgi:FMNH2-dependent dimethyl sulfone monooxygenase
MTMRYGYWMPVFGGWLRNVADEPEASYAYCRDLAQRAEEIGFDLTLIAELYLNDIKGRGAPTLDAWSLAAAIAAVTERQEIMVAVRPNFHQPGPFAKMATTIQEIAQGRLSLNVVSSWWAGEAKQFGLQFDEHGDRYARTSEWLDVLHGLWSQEEFDHDGDLYRLENAALAPKPDKRPIAYAGGESEAAKTLIATKCDAYVMHGDTPDVIAPKVADMRARREQAGGPPMSFGMASYAIVRDSEAEAQRELERILDVKELPPGYDNFDEWLSGTELERELKIREYSVSNRGLRPNLVGTPEQLKQRVADFEGAGVDLLLLQMSPQKEEMERFAAQVIA